MKKVTLSIYFVAHNGLYACERCVQEGIYADGYHCMTFPELNNFTLRTNASFRGRRNAKHHNGLSPFLRLKEFDMINGFPLDYMHLVLLGMHYLPHVHTF